MVLSEKSRLNMLVKREGIPYILMETLNIPHNKNDRTYQKLLSEQ